MSRTAKLRELLEYYMGEPADFFITKVFAEANVGDPEHMDENKSFEVVRRLLSEVISPIVGKHRLLKIREELCKIFDLPERLIH